MFKEGDIIDFRLLKTVELGSKGLNFILLSPEGKKFMIPSKEYSDYNFQIGDIVKCKIDKVNCSGKVFLEPLNPHYEAGKSYRFKYEYSEEVYSDLGEKRYFIYVKDVFGKMNKILSIRNVSADFENKMICNVLQVKKGSLLLSIKHNKHSVKEHNYYTFEVVERTVVNGEDSFILRDPFNSKHHISCDVYKNYKIRVGQLIKARVDKYDLRGNYKIEPKHPFFKIDDKYLFRFIEERRIGSQGDELQDVIVVDDGFGGEAYVTPYPKNFLKDNDKDKLPCVVERISNATVFLKGI